MARKIIEAVILTVIFTIVAGCFSIPIIIFATDSQNVTPEGNVADQLDISDCARQVWLYSAI